MRYLIIILIGLYPVTALAQYNSDYKTVAKQKIRTATAYKLDDWGDSVFYRCTYDIKGRLIETSYYGKNQGEFTYTYSVSGKTIGFHHVFISATEIGLPNPTGKTIRFDTALIWSWRINEATGEKEYEMHLDYDHEGKRQNGSLQRVSGDTTRFYWIRNGNYVLYEFTIKSKVDSLRRGYTETYYQMPYESSGRRGKHDTTVWAYLHVEDKKGHDIRCYHITGAEEQPIHTRGINGSLYTPATDTLAYLTIICSYKNVYRRDGSLEYRIVMNPWTRESKREDGYKPNPVAIPINSLQGVKEYGPVGYTYYQP